MTASNFRYYGFVVRFVDAVVYDAMTQALKRGVHERRIARTTRRQAA